MFATVQEKSMHCQSKRKAFIDLSNIPSHDETSYKSIKKYNNTRYVTYKNR